MKPIRIEEIASYVEHNIQGFHKSRLNSMKETDLRDLLKKKNPYLFKAKNMLTAETLIESFLEAKLSASEEELFGAFLEDLAIFIAGKTLGASKSPANGIDFGYKINDTHYLVSIKSGLNWGNSSQWAALGVDFNNARRVLSQSHSVKHIKTILGVCYGKARTTTKRGTIMQVCGQNFWYMISGNEDLYTEIIEPLGHRAKEHNETFEEEKAALINRFTRDFTKDFCDKHGNILWDKLVEFNSGNMTDNGRSHLV